MSVREKRNGKYHTMLEQGDVYPGSYQVGPTFNGPTSDAGLRIKHIEGKSTQAVSRGYQLFDASRLSSGTANGVTFTNNGNGSFAVSGEPTSGSFIRAKLLTHDEVLMLFKAGVLRCATNNHEPYFYIKFVKGIASTGSIGECNTKNRGSFTIRKEDLDDPVLTAEIGFYGVSSNWNPPSNGLYKPMFYQDGDGTWEPFTGGKPGPQPEYPIPINSYLVNGFASSYDGVPIATKNPFYLRSLPDGTCDEYKDGKIIRRVGIVTLDGSSDESWTMFDTVNGYTRALFIEPSGDKLLLDLTGNTRCTRFPVTGKVAGSNSTWPNPDHECLCAVSSNTPGNTGLIVKGEYTNAQLRAWLQTHPFDVYYKLGEPMTEDAPELPILHSRVPNTSAWSDSSLKPVITWEALPAGSCALEVQELRKRIEALERKSVEDA